MEHEITPGIKYRITSSTSKELVPQVHSAMQQLLTNYHVRWDSPQPLWVSGRTSPSGGLEVKITPKGENFFINAMLSLLGLDLPVALKEGGEPAKLVFSGPDHTTFTFDGKTVYNLYHIILVLPR